MQYFRICDYWFLTGVSPILSKLRDQGCTADYLENVVITKTFPNHASIATGLYPETHGVMGNSLFDPVLGKKLQYSYELWHYNEQVTPLWVTKTVVCLYRMVICGFQD